MGSTESAPRIAVAVCADLAMGQLYLLDTSVTTIDTLGTAKYLSLTTFRADGTPVATPVWLVRDGDALRVITQGDSGKVKRLRRTSRVLVAPCDARGRLAGAQVEGEAHLQDVEETARTQRLITERYGLLGRFLMWRNRRRADKDGVSAAGIEIRIP
jgi:PPOX class probable F420-dependent enzyme